ncbi:hypothetical protein HBB16_07100 [Pseudonocardia sp. MCCB 268]|nr:hypothetical protein [Pseudonocardia cytotoxica]
MARPAPPRRHRRRDPADPPVARTAHRRARGRHRPHAGRAGCGTTGEELSARWERDVAVHR